MLTLEYYHGILPQASLADFIRIEPAVDPTTDEPLGDERFHVFIEKKCYPAKVFNLPCLTESYARTCVRPRTWSVGRSVGRTVAVAWARANVVLLYFARHVHGMEAMGL